MKFIKVLAVLLLTSGILVGEQPHVEQAIRLLSTEAKLMRNEMGLKVFSSGGGFLKCINSLELTVECPVSVDLEKGRMLYAVSLFQWITSTNEDKEAIPYFKNFPMTVENFEYRILFADFDVCSTKENPKLAFIFNLGNNVVYCFRNEATKSLEPFLREKFNEEIMPMLLKAVQERSN